MVKLISFPFTRDNHSNGGLLSCEPVKVVTKEGTCDGDANLVDKRVNSQYGVSGV